ncbi:hypothetical protein BD779DRAFT_1486317 [Infundibulicybe gibba]|nr:hypothetical protein BD779DRAFT_1486317 [Infundibulicybe gibba]
MDNEAEPHVRSPDRGTSNSSNHPSAKIWSVYISEAEKQDIILVQTWRGDMNATLIFAGLFSASITAFLIESYRLLTPNSEDLTVSILWQMSQQLAVMSNSSLPDVSIPPPALAAASFTPSHNAILCNLFWFLSLAFSLVCALAATLVDQWARTYAQATENQPAPHKRARVRAYLHEGLQRFGIKTVVETIPALLHVSLLLFFAGLVEFLVPINNVLSHLIAAILAIFACLYITTTWLLILYHDCPYQTPFSDISWQLLQLSRILLHRWLVWGPQKCHINHLSQAREVAALEKSPRRDERDGAALCWTLESLTEDSNLEPFVESLTGFVYEDVAEDGECNALILIVKNMMSNRSINLGSRIASLLRQSMYLPEAVKQRRSIVCLTAIWQLLVSCWDPPKSSEDTQPGLGTWFDEETLPIMETLQYDVGITPYLTSTRAIYTMKLLDDLARLANAAEQDVSRVNLDRPWDEAEPWPEQSKVDKYVLCTAPEISYGCLVAMRVWWKRIEQAVALLEQQNGNNLHQTPQNILSSLWSFQATINEARIIVLLEFVEVAVVGELPVYEAIETMYELSMDTSSNLSIFSVTTHTQTWFLELLEDIMRNMKLPHIAIDRLLRLVVLLDEPAYIDRARIIITHYSSFASDNNRGFHDREFYPNFVSNFVLNFFLDF